MEKKEELLERLVNELAAQNKLIALLIAKNNVETFGKSGIEIVEEMEKESVCCRMHFLPKCSMSGRKVME